MNVLIACEESQTICKAMRELGHEAFSCDLQNCSGGHPEWHINDDALNVLFGNCHFFDQLGGWHMIEGKWDLVIAHPPCTYLSNAGACRLYPHEGQLDKDRYIKGLKAKEFFMAFYWYGKNGNKIAIENPIPSSIYDLPEKTQAIQPYEFGEPYTKKTYLWLFGLDPLMPTNIVKPVGPYVCGNSKIWKEQAAKGKVYGKEKSAKVRSKTFEGIARAMSEQWAGRNET